MACYWRSAQRLHSHALRETTTVIYSVQSAREVL